MTTTRKCPKARPGDVVKDLRAKAVAFVTSKGGQAGREEIKEHLGLDLWAYSEPFNQAMKTTKLVPLHSKGEISPGIFLRRPPIVAYRLA